MKLKMVPSAIFKAVGVRPGADSNLRLPEGTYTVAAQSTVPFVMFTGGSHSEKVISYNERVTVEKGEAVRILNGSYHTGDIFLTNDLEYTTRPARITIPFKWNIPINEMQEGDLIFPTEKADCRLARRVYASVFINVGEEPTLPLVIFGQNKEHSLLSGLPIILNNGFQYEYPCTPASILSVIPLGYMAYNNILPMALLDYGWFSFNCEARGLVPDTTGFYIIEY